MKAVMNSPDIKLLVVCHKPAFVPKTPFLYPVQVGAAEAEERLPGMAHDDEGENISAKNPFYCEMTAVYWAWKNLEADFYGLFHYRRYLSFDPGIEDNDEFGNIAVDRIAGESLGKLGLSPETIAGAVMTHDIVTVRPRELGKTVFNDYRDAPDQHADHLELAMNVLRKRHPEYSETAKSYLKSTKAYECNMFVMPRALFREYCEWMFGILSEIEEGIDFTDMNVRESRVMGYLAERLTGIFILHQKNACGKNVMETGKVFARDTEPELSIPPAFPGKNAVSIVLSSNSLFIPFLDTTVRSILENASADRCYDIVVFHGGVSPARYERVLGMNGPNVRIRFFNVRSFFASSDFFVTEEISIETYYRLAIPELMAAYDKVLYLDVDLVADRDVADLFDIDVEGCCLAGTRDVDVCGQIKTDYQGMATHLKEVLKMASPFDYLQAGVVLFNARELRKSFPGMALIRIALSRKWRYQDQDVMNYACQGRIKFIDPRWNVLMNWRNYANGESRIGLTMSHAPRRIFLAYLESRKSPWVFHYAGYQKPWKCGNCDFAFHFWKYARLSAYYPEILQWMPSERGSGTLPGFCAEAVKTLAAAETDRAINSRIVFRFAIWMTESTKRAIDFVFRPGSKLRCAIGRLLGRG